MQVFLGVAAAILILRVWYADTIAAGVRVQGVSLAGLNRREAIACLQKRFPQPRPDSVLALVAPDGEAWEVRHAEIAWVNDYEAAVGQALAAGKGIRLPGDLAAFFKLAFSGLDIPLPTRFDEQALRSVLTRIAAGYRRAPQDARVVFEAGNITVLPESPGYAIDIEQTVARFRTAPVTTCRLPLAVHVIQPALRSSDLQDINARLSIFATQFNPHDEARTRNLKLAATLLDHRLLQPGQVFSFNAAIGPRTPERGFAKAPVLVGNHLTNGIGGGICQVATTLYNAVLLADLPVLNRTGHSRPVPYAPPGRDATVAEDIVDFRFRNNRRHPVLITTRITGNTLVVALYGHAEDARNTVFRTETVRKVLPAETIYRFDPSLAPGEIKIADPGRDGYVLTTYEVMLVNNRVVSRVVVAERRVSPRAAVIYTGSRPIRAGAGK